MTAGKPMFTVPNLQCDQGGSICDHACTRWFCREAFDELFDVPDFGTIDLEVYDSPGPGRLEFRKNDRNEVVFGEEPYYITRYSRLAPEWDLLEIDIPYWTRIVRCK